MITGHSKNPNTTPSATTCANVFSAEVLATARDPKAKALVNIEAAIAW
jgi:hypothetical protein